LTTGRERHGVVDLEGPGIHRPVAHPADAAVAFEDEHPVNLLTLTNGSAALRHLPSGLFSG
jgi:hypothetical protein